MEEYSLDYFKLPAHQKYHIYRITGSEVSQRPHRHDYYQICYVECGRVTHQQGSSTVPLEAGDTFIIPPGFVHQLHFPDQDAFVYSLSFHEALFHPGFSQSNVYHFMTALKMEAMASERIPIRMKVQLDLPRQQTVKGLMDALIREQDNSCPPELTAAASLIAAILCILSQGYFLEDVTQLQAVEACSKAMEQCLRYLDAHFTQDLVLEETARKFGLSRSKFSLLFPQHTGMTFKRYLTQKRIDYAVTLIRSTELPVQQIAQMAGYSDLSTFYRNFTKVTGASPSTYRCPQDLERHLTLSIGYFF